MEQSLLKKWFDESKDKVKAHLKTKKDEEFIIYGGFKLQLFDGKYSIRDVRLCDVYTEVEEEDAKVLKEYGFIEGVDRILFERNKERFSIHAEKLEESYDQKKELLSKLNDEDFEDFDKKNHMDKLKDCQDNIDSHRDFKFLYRARIFQHLTKYNSKLINV